MLYAPANGNIDCTNGFLYNSSCSLSCDTGYDASGTTWRTCLESNAWSGEDDFNCTGTIICHQYFQNVDFNDYIVIF